MANIINGTDTGSGGLITTGDSSDELQLQTAETARVTLTNTAVVVNEGGNDLDFRVEGDTDANLLFVDASADAVGIGTNTTTDAGVTITRSVTRDSSWDAKLALQSTGSNDYPALLFSGCSDTDRYGAIVSTTSTSGSDTNKISAEIMFPLTSATTGEIRFTTNGDIGTTNSAERARFTSDGYLRMASGSGGIQFNGDTAAANALDDYEEGTWTPSVGGTATYGNRYGNYTKIGNVVTCQFRITISSIGTGSAFQMSGLPFTSANIGSVQTGCCSYFGNLPTNTTTLSFYVENNLTTIQFVGQNAADGTCINGMVVFGNSAEIYGAVSYFAA